MSRVKDSGLVGIMAVDPGGTTGVAWGVVDLGAGSIAEAMNERTSDGSVEVTGTYWEQAEALATLWVERFFFWHVELGLAVDRCYLVFEEFILTMRPGSSDPAGLMPVRVAACTVGVLGSHAALRGRGIDVDTIVGTDQLCWQLPSELKNFATKPRLRKWGGWVRGSAHQRDAWGHFALKVAKLI